MGNGNSPILLFCTESEKTSLTWDLMACFNNLNMFKFFDQVVLLLGVYLKPIIRHVQRFVCTEMLLVALDYNSEQFGHLVTNLSVNDGGVGQVNDDSCMHYNIMGSLKGTL